MRLNYGMVVKAGLWSIKGFIGTSTNSAPALLAAGVIVIFFSACSSHPASGTTVPTTAPQPVIQQYIPSDYYSCSVATPENLCQAYFSRYYNIADAEQEYNNQVFVFKNMVITSEELNYATADYIWVDGIIQCYFMKSGDANRLKAGDVVDIVGVDSGDSRDYSGTLIFTGCLFLPAGSIQLPAGGTSALNIPVY
jgi:hypothetical protein